MNKQLIQEYFNEIDRLRRVSGTTTDNVIRGAFRDLLKSWSRQRNLHLLDEYGFESTQRTRIRPDGTIKHDLRLDLGYWEARDPPTTSIPRSTRSRARAIRRPTSSSRIPSVPC